MSTLKVSIKQNAHWILLGGCSLLSVGSLWLSQSELEEWTREIEALRPMNTPTKKAPPLNVETLEKAASALGSPAQWTADFSTALFVSEHYLVENGVLRNPENASFYRHSDGRPIENSWFNQFPSLAKALGKPRLHLEDSDEDGFTNEEEWAAHSDPTNPKSHPPLRSKLFLVSQTQISHRFRLKKVDNFGTPAVTAMIERLDEQLPAWLQNSKRNTDQIKALQFFRPVLRPGQLMGEITIEREEAGRKEQVSIGESNLRLLAIEEITDSKVPLMRAKLRDEKSGRERFATKPSNTNDSKDPALVKDADFEVKNILLAYRHRLVSKDIQTELGSSVELAAPNGASEKYTLKDSTRDTVILTNSDGVEFEITTESNRTPSTSLNRP
jgi:hypothetical protein